MKSKAKKTKKKKQKTKKAINIIKVCTTASFINYVLTHIIYSQNTKKQPKIFATECGGKVPFPTNNKPFSDIAPISLYFIK